MKIRLLGFAPLFVLCAAAAFAQPATAQTVTTDLYTKGGTKVYHIERQLTKSEVRGMLANTEFLELYNQGIKKNRAGNAWLIASGGLLVATAAYTGIATSSGYTKDGTHTVAGMSAEDWAVVGVGAGATVFAALFGLIKKGQGAVLVRDAVNGYGSAGKTSVAELTLGLTGNGVGLVLKF